MSAHVFLGDCREVLKQLPENYVDTVITDPPYELNFMGKSWDKSGVAFDPETWKAVLRVAKPGAFLLAFGGTRTWHRLACAIEDAGWEIRDTMLMLWAYGSGFPKSHNICKSIDKAARGVPHGGPDPTSLAHGKYKTGCSEDNPGGRGFGAGPGQFMKEQAAKKEQQVVDEAKPWEGWGTSLKPAWEPVIVAMKPLDSTFAANALTHGVAGLNIEAGRIGSSGGGTHCTNRDAQGRCKGHKNAGRSTSGETFHGPETAGGRWPANLLLSHTENCALVGYTDDKGYVINRFTDGAKPFGDGAGHEYETEEIAGGKREVYACPPSCPVRILDDQTGVLKSGGPGKDGASRFFYCSKVSKRERAMGLPEGVKNTHNTVKPLALMRYLCRLTATPTQGIVLDPFCGSGSTGVACIREGRDFVGVELEEESCDIARLRIKHALETPEEAPKQKKAKKTKKRKSKKRKKKKA